MASQAERNARLDRLSTAADSWANKRKRELEAEARMLRTIMKGRTGSERLNNSTVSAASDLVVEEINQFLTGD